MDKKQLLMDMLSVMQNAKIDGKHHKRHHGSKTHEHKKDKPREQSDELRLPPSARNILLILLDDKKTNQRTLAKRMNITAQGVSDVMKKLEQNELILRERGEIYNENIIHLTEKGEKIAKDFDEKVKLRSENLFKDFTQDDLEKLQQLLEKLAKNQSEIN